MDKVIIDGVDVSECSYYSSETYPYTCEVWDNECEAQNCYFKQFQRARAEIEQLKSDIESRTMCITCERELQNYNLQAENERLKEENYQLQKNCQICENFIDFIPCKPIRDMDYDLQKVINQRDNYYQTLQEIREDIKDCNNGKCLSCKYNSNDLDNCRDKMDCSIIAKINEVIGAE